MKKNYPEITKLRGFAILMVLLYHSIIVYPIDLRAIGWCANLADVLWHIEMPLFFLVSGFCFSYEGKYSSYIVKKVKRILIPHLVFGIVDLLFRVLPQYVPFMSKLVNKEADVIDGAKDFLLYASIDPFLRSLFIMFLVFPIVSRLINKGKIYKYLVCAGALLLYVFCDNITNIMALSYFARFFVFFLVGHVIRENGYEKIKTILLRPLIILSGMVLSVLSFVCFLLPGMKTVREIPGIESMLILIAALSGALVIYAVANVPMGIVDRFVNMAGNYSLQLYLLGGYVLVLSRVIVVTYMKITLPVPVILLNFIIDVSVMYVLIHFIIRKVSLFCFLTGLTYKKKSKTERIS